MEKAADLFTLLGFVFGPAILTLSLAWVIYNLFKPSFTRRWLRLRYNLLELATHDGCLSHVQSKFAPKRRRVSLPEAAICQIFWMLDRLAEAGDERIKESLGADRSGLKLTWYLLLNRPGDFHDLLEERIAQGETGPVFNRLQSLYGALLATYLRVFPDTAPGYEMLMAGEGDGERLAKSCGLSVRHTPPAELTFADRILALGEVELVGEPVLFTGQSIEVGQLMGIFGRLYRVMAVYEFFAGDQLAFRTLALYSFIPGGIAYLTLGEPYSPRELYLDLEVLTDVSELNPISPKLIFREGRYSPDTDGIWNLSLQREYELVQAGMFTPRVSGVELGPVESAWWDSGNRRIWAIWSGGDGSAPVVVQQQQLSNVGDGNPITIVS